MSRNALRPVPWIARLARAARACQLAAAACCAAGLFASPLRRGDSRLRARLAGAGIHARHPRIGQRRSRTRCCTLKNPHASVLDLEGVELDPRARAACRVWLHAATIRTSSRSASARFKPGVVRLVIDLKDGGEAAGVRAAAGRRIRPPPGARPLSADAARSADGAARERSAAIRGAADKPADAATAAREAAPTRAVTDHRRDRSRPRRRGSRRRSGGAAPTRRT